MSYIEKSIQGDEKIVKTFKIHTIVYLEYILFLWLIFPIIGLIKLFFIENGLTTKRVIFKSGIISRDTEEMRLSKIETVEIKQGIIGRIFGYGSVIISGTGTSNVVFNYVSGPLNVKKEIESQLDKI
jgi:uncharacterized membrane protein YdbT with pleckstrin-like domain